MGVRDWIDLRWVPLHKILCVWRERERAYGQVPIHGGHGG